MNYRPNDIDRLAKQIMQEVASDFSNSGIFHRVFFRCKSNKSLDRKLSITNSDGTLKYDSKDKRIRDLVGIRVNLYFVDDLEIITEFIKSKYADLFEEETIDENKTTEFKPTRINLIFRIPRAYISEFRQVVKDDRIDATFELQLRTIFSEGWHEVEHDLRYKCQSDWEPYPEMSRMFNGFLAALETQEWSMIQLFDRIAYQHYKNDNLNGLIRMKFRIRFEDAGLSPDLVQLINSNDVLQKDMFKLDRNKFVDILLKKTPMVPLTFDNVFFIINYYFLRNDAILSRMPEILAGQLGEEVLIENQY